MQTHWRQSKSLMDVVINLLIQLIPKQNLVWNTDQPSLYQHRQETGQIQEDQHILQAGAELPTLKYIAG